MTIFSLNVYQIISSFFRKKNFFSLNPAFSSLPRRGLSPTLFLSNWTLFFFIFRTTVLWKRISVLITRIAISKISFFLAIFTHNRYTKSFFILLCYVEKHLSHRCPLMDDHLLLRMGISGPLSAHFTLHIYSYSVLWPVSGHLSVVSGGTFSIFPVIIVCMCFGLTTNTYTKVTGGVVVVFENFFLIYSSTKTSTYKFIFHTIHTF